MKGPAEVFRDIAGARHQRFGGGAGSESRPAAPICGPSPGRGASAQSGSAGHPGARRPGAWALSGVHLGYKVRGPCVGEAWTGAGPKTAAVAEVCLVRTQRFAASTNLLRAAPPCRAPASFRKLGASGALLSARIGRLPLSPPCASSRRRRLRLDACPPQADAPPRLGAHGFVPSLRARRSR